jgi:hypothetical protein
MSSAMQTEVQAGANRPFHLINIAFTTGTAYLTNAGQNVSYGGNTYLAAGQFLGFDSIPESAMVEVTEIIGTLSGVDQTYISTLLATDYIDREVNIYLAFFDATYSMVVDPLLLFKGRISGAQINDEHDPSGVGNTCSIELSASSVFVDFERLSGRHTTQEEQGIHFATTDKGFEFVSDVANKELMWGRA